MREYQKLLDAVKDCKAGTKPAPWNESIKLPFVIAAKITFSKEVPDPRFVLKSRRFSHVDMLVHEGTMKAEGPTCYSINAACVDEKLNSVFGLTANPLSIVMSPRHYFKPESFVDYFLMVRRNLPGDVKAELSRY